MFLTDHKHCTGCGACIDACPQSAVVKIRDKYKFVYPSVNEDLCDLCGRCLEICPKDRPIVRDMRDEFEQRYYAAKAIDKHIVKSSHAGGIFRLLAMKILADGGAVYGCIFDENRHPCHVRADNVEMLDKMYGMKPVQSDTDGVYLSVLEDLKKGISVLFSGTPCQCDGLRGFLGRDYVNLMVVDVLCSGVTSEGVFNRYYYWFEQKLGGKIMELKFENKSAFGRQRGIRVLYRRGRQRFLLSYPLELDRLNAMQLRGTINRRSCGDCKYACRQRVGDISLGRFVNIRHAHPDFPYENGVSLVVVSTPKGAEFFDSVKKEMYVELSDFERASANTLLSAPTAQDFRRKKILSEICSEGFGAAADKLKMGSFLGAVKVFCSALIPDRVEKSFDLIMRELKHYIKSLKNRLKGLLLKIKGK